jgi:hypothetical protein
MQWLPGGNMGSLNDLMCGWPNHNFGYHLRLHLNRVIIYIFQLAGPSQGVV